MCLFVSLSLFPSLAVCVCLCLAVPDLAASQTSTDVSRGAVGSHSIEEAPGSRAAFSLPLGSVWAAQQKAPLPISPPAPRPKPPPKLQRSPYCCQLSMHPFLLSKNPRPASISRRYSIHRRRALITKQDYGPCLGTTCQGACSLSCSLSTTHTLHRRVCLCVFGEEDGDLISSDGDTVQIIVNSF